MMPLFIIGFLMFVTGMMIASLADDDGFLIAVGVILSCIGGYMVGSGLVQAFAQ